MDSRGRNANPRHQETWLAPKSQAKTTIINSRFSKLKKKNNLKTKIQTNVTFARSKQFVKGVTAGKVRDGRAVLPRSQPGTGTMAGLGVD